LEQKNTYEIDTLSLLPQPRVAVEPFQNVNRDLAIKNISQGNCLAGLKTRVYDKYFTNLTSIAVRGIS